MNEPEGNYWHGAVPGTGLTVLFEPPEPSLDIVFIHGFTGHPERTWTSKKGNVRHRNDDRVAGEFVEPPPKIRKLNLFSSSHHDKGDALPATYWPRDLVPATAPSTRVLTYGYDTHIRHWMQSPVNRNTVYDISWDLLVALESERRTEPSRPVLFVVHSLGGIIVKEMLRRSRSCHMGQIHLRDIQASTTGIIFFGTPHAGTDPRGFLQRIAERVIKAAGFSVNEQIVNALLPTSERLRELRDEFGPMAQEQNWIIHSFQEQVGVRLLNNQKVVDDTSSYLNVEGVEITEHIGRNHMEMCRFMGLDDVEYKKVAAALCRITTAVSRQPTTVEQSPLGEEQKRVLLDSLRFDQIDARQSTIKNAHAKTCKWLLEQSEYLDWLDPGRLGEHHGFLWIKGKPGTGKSTLMKFALANARKKRKHEIVISFFFNARGDDLEKSTSGMYRSLLLQLLERLPALQDVFDSLGLAAWNGGCHQWSVESLKALFEQAVQSLGKSSVACFIDALDECDERQIRDMVSFFEHLGELATSAGIRFRVCFSSRHYPHITIAKGLGLILEGQEGHNQDIVSYLNSELKIGHSKLAEQIRTDLQEKASEVFMWVVLVVEILNKEHDNGNIHVLQRRLREIPGDLHDLFRDILTRDHHSRGNLLLCIQWVLFARQPLKPEQLYFAILSGVEPEALSEWNPDEITAAVMKRFILNSSKGLTEVTKSKTPTVQFIHESVKDFLLKENGLREIWSDLGGNFEGASHERLKQCCLSYMGIDIATSLEIAGSLPTANSQKAAELRQSANQKFPFLEYATRNVLYHADAAEAGGISQMGFLQSFQLTDWIKLDNLFERREVRRFTAKASFLYILSERNMAALIRLHPSKKSCFVVEGERYGPPIFAALATYSNQAVESFVEACLEMQLQGSPLRDLCKDFSENRNMSIKMGRNFTFLQKRSVLSYVVEQEYEAFLTLFIASGQANAKVENGRSPLSFAAEKGYKTVVKELLLIKGVDTEMKDTSGRTALWYAAGRGHEAVVRLLLEKGGDSEVKDANGCTLLLWAAEGGHEAVVRLLLNSYIDVKRKDKEGWALLLQATERYKAVVQPLLDSAAEFEGKDKEGWALLLRFASTGHKAAVGLLFNRAANFEEKDSSGQTLLSWAAARGHKAVVRLLLETGKAEVESKDNLGRTPLSHAAERGHKAVVRLLLETGKAEVESKDNLGRTPLLHAAERGHEAVVRLLFETGKAEVELKDNLGRTPLLHAAERGHKAVVRLLLETGKAEVESKDSNWGRTPLLHAAERGHEAVVRLLFETGKAEVESKDSSLGRTPLSWAAERGHEAVVRLLLETGKAEVESKDSSLGRTPLSWAAERGHEAVVRLLLETGKAEVESNSNWGRTPLSYAAEQGHEAVVRLLKSHGAKS